MPRNLMIRDLLLILSCTGCAELYTDNAKNSSIFFKKFNKKIKVSLRGSYVSILFSYVSTFLFIEIFVTIFCFDLNKMIP